MRVPPAVVVALMISLWGVSRFLADPNLKIQNPGLQMKSIFWLTAIFWVWHVLGVARAEEHLWAMKEFSRLSVGLLCFWAMYFYSGIDPPFIKNSMVTSIWVMTLLLGFLIYKYAFVFHAPSLGITMDFSSRANKNQLAWFLAAMIPYCWAYFLRSTRPVLGMLPMTVFIVAWLYTSSRGSWICGSIGVSWVTFLLRKTDGSRSVQRIFSVSILIVLVIFGLISFMQNKMDLNALDLMERVATLSSQDDLGEDYSIGIRLELVEIALDLFGEAPLLGSGLSNLRIAMGKVSHNDYLGILAEMGLVGLLVFVMILIMFSSLILNSGKGTWLQAGAQGSFLAMLVYLSFINVYTTAMFWVMILYSVIIAQQIVILPRSR